MACLLADIGCKPVDQLPGDPAQFHSIGSQILFTGKATFTAESIKGPKKEVTVATVKTERSILIFKPESWSIYLTFLMYSLLVPKWIH